MEMLEATTGSASTMVEMVAESRAMEAMVEAKERANTTMVVGAMPLRPRLRLTV